MLINTGVKFKEGMGCYEGNSNRCFICITDNQYEVDFIKNLAKLFKQESILVVDERGKSVVEYLNGVSKVFVGKWQETTREEATKLKSYTYDHETNTFYKVA